MAKTRQRQTMASEGGKGKEAGRRGRAEEGRGVEDWLNKKAAAGGAKSKSTRGKGKVERKGRGWSKKESQKVRAQAGATDLTKLRQMARMERREMEKKRARQARVMAGEY